MQSILARVTIKGKRARGLQTAVLENGKHKDNNKEYILSDQIWKFFLQKQPEILSLYTPDITLEPKTHFASGSLCLICYLSSKVSQPSNIHISLLFQI